MIIQVHPVNPETRHIKKIVELLEGGGVIIFPTDSVYALGCDARSRRAVEKLQRIAQADKNKMMSLMCKDFSQIATYAQVSQYAFRAMKHHLPGPYVFILPPSRQVAKLLLSKRQTIGIRMSRNPTAAAIVEAFGEPLFTTSVKGEDDEFIRDPEVIHDRLGYQVDAVVDAGDIGGEPSSVIDLVGDQPEIVRHGKGDLTFFL